MMEVNSVQWTSSPDERRGAWARVFLDDLDGFLLVRTSRRSGSRRITGLVLMPGEGDSMGQMLKDLPLSRIEFFLRQLPEMPAEVEHVDEDGAVEVFHDPLGTHIFKEWNRAEGASVRSVEGDRDEHRRPALTRPDKSGDDVFYKQVAEAYAEVMARTRAVAPTLAEEANVPVRTVHRWVAEARRRGFLPPTSRGRA